MHKFSLGQSVFFSSRATGRLTTRAPYKIIKLMPVEADQYRYRIKANHETFERTAEEHQLTRD